MLYIYIYLYIQFIKMYYMMYKVQARHNTCNFKTPVVKGMAQGSKVYQSSNI